ncbi:DUF2591 domain-containing protein [Pseudomonas silvicola]|nr:DUF2591 domain-containing protein [Pseudomonas silvicola]
MMKERHPDLIEVNVATLSGEALGWAVGKAEGLDVLLASPVYGNPWRVFVRYTGEVTIREVRYAPQDSWADGGPLISKYRVLITPPNEMVHRNFGPFDKRNGYYESGLWGSTIFGKERKHRRASFHHQDSPLTAAMRAIVQFELGDTVQVPKELIP